LAGRIEIANRAEKAIKKIIDNDIEFYRKFARPYPPDAYQYMWLQEYSNHNRCVHPATPRTRKTTTASLHFFRKIFKHRDVEVLHVAPRVDQAKSQGYRNVYEWIAQSELLKAFVKRSATGKLMLYDDHLELYNGSKYRTFGIDSKFEGFNATDIWIDETDDIPEDGFKKVFDRGLAKNKNGLPTFYLLTGMIKTRGNLYRFENDPLWHVVQPRMDLYLAIQLGVINLEDAKTARGMYTQEEWLRLMHLIYVESKNFIWESKLWKSQIVGLKWGLKPERVLPNRVFKRIPGSIIAIGLDMGAQGSGEDASEYALEVVQGFGRYRRWLYSKVWPPTIDPSVLINDVVRIWEYFRPDGGYGDALGANLITQINTELYERGLVDYDWSLFGDNSAKAWREWAECGLLTPLRNSGMVKHAMFMSLKTALDNISNLEDEDSTGNVFIFPQEDRSVTREEWQELTILLRELSNLTAERTKAGYLSIGRIKKKIEDTDVGFSGTIKLGDDRADALAMANYFLDFKMKEFGQQDFKVAATVGTRQ